MKAFMAGDDLSMNIKRKSWLLSQRVSSPKPLSLLAVCV
jgi:hypothetical protein